MIYIENIQSMLLRYKTKSIEDSIFVESLSKKFFLNKEMIIFDSERLKQFIYSNFDLINDNTNIYHLLFDKYGEVWNKMLSTKDIETFELLIAICELIGIFTIPRTTKVDFISKVGKEPDLKNKQCLSDSLQKEIRDYISKYAKTIYDGFYIEIDREAALKYNPVDIMTKEDLIEYANEFIFKIDTEHSLKTIETAGKLIDLYPEDIIGLISIIVHNKKPLSELLDYIDDGSIVKKIASVRRYKDNPSISLKLDKIKKDIAYSYKMEKKNSKEIEEIKRHR